MDFVALSVPGVAKPISEKAFCSVSKCERGFCSCSPQKALFDNLRKCKFNLGKLISAFPECSLSSVVGECILHQHKCIQIDLCTGTRPFVEEMFEDHFEDPIIHHKVLCRLGKT